MNDATSSPSGSSITENGDSNRKVPTGRQASSPGAPYSSRSRLVDSPRLQRHHLVLLRDGDGFGETPAVRFGGVVLARGQEL
ncbi:hypothetical protein GJ632_20615 [Halogeometricum sp. CBA1124]|nr:hypothetical protein [Halogeometricum sp. CBA1124]MUV59087.1 hypothetical protein [Halogeometricum sp. CBA1124]